MTDIKAAIKKIQDEIQRLIGELDQMMAGLEGQDTDPAQDGEA